MFIYTKNLILFLYYSCVCIAMLTEHLNYEKGFYFSFFPIMMIYYLAMLFPKIHHNYVYYVIERKGVRWKDVWRLYFHFSLYLGSNSLFATLATIIYFSLYKELNFIIHYAENRLAKIEEAIYEKLPGFRIAHLHLNVFTDDMSNRFHEHCFKTNRLYILESTPASKSTQLGISNYREIRRKKKEPREMDDREIVMYEASSNKTLFIDHRNYFIYTPVALLFFFIIFTDVSNTLRSYVNLLLILSDVLTFLFTNSDTNDIFIDLIYAVFALVYGIEHYTPLIPS